MIKYFKLLYYTFYRPKIFFPKKNYSMFGEDKFITNYFKKKTSGFYIDVGCYHPLDGNNTHLLHKKGWSGINIDINFYSISLFNFLRKKDTNIHSGISHKKDSLIMYYRKEINMLNTLDSKIAKIRFKNGYKKKKVSVNTLNFFIKKNYKKLKKIDFLNIDVEGSERSVLRSLDFNHYKPQLICIEIHDKEIKKSKIYEYLNKSKYQLIWSGVFSHIFKSKA